MLMRVLRVHFRFRSPSWISGHVTSGSHVTLKTLMSTRSTYTWSGKNGGRKSLSPRWENGLRKRSERLTSGSFWTNFFSFGHRCGWHGANSLSKNQTEPVFLTTQNVRTKSPLAQVGLKRCDLVTDKRLGVADTSEPGDRARHFFLFIYFFLKFIYLFIFIYESDDGLHSFLDCSAAISFCFVSGSQKILRSQSSSSKYRGQRRTWNTLRCFQKSFHTFFHCTIPRAVSITKRILSSSSSNMTHSCCNWDGWSKKHPLHYFFIAEGINGFSWRATALISCSSISMTNRCECCEVLEVTDDGSGCGAFYTGGGVTFAHQSEGSMWGDTPSNWKAGLRQVPTCSSKFRKLIHFLETPSCFLPLIFNVMETLDVVRQLSSQNTHPLEKVAV